eukprot:m.97691 g.97691  ORF g.97691 m.97691 type:complete len:199 (+) comp12500_c1_seq4:141-737(+)
MQVCLFPLTHTLKCNALTFNEFMFCCCCVVLCCVEGRVQSLLQSAAIYASSMSSFCKELPVLAAFNHIYRTHTQLPKQTPLLFIIQTLWRVGLLTEGLIKRLYFGVQQEIREGERTSVILNKHQKPNTKLFLLLLLYHVVALMDIPFMRPGRARTLVDAGYVTYGSFPFAARVVWLLLSSHSDDHLNKQQIFVVVFPF